MSDDRKYRLSEADGSIETKVEIHGESDVFELTEAFIRFAKSVGFHEDGIRRGLEASLQEHWPAPKGGEE